MGIETAECVSRVEANLFSPHLAQFLRAVFLYLQIKLADVLNLFNHFVKSTFVFHPMRFIESTNERNWRAAKRKHSPGCCWLSWSWPPGALKHGNPPCDSLSGRRLNCKSISNARSLFSFYLIMPFNWHCVTTSFWGSSKQLCVASSLCVLLMFSRFLFFIFHSILSRKFFCSFMSHITLQLHSAPRTDASFSASFAHWSVPARKTCYDEAWPASLVPIGCAPGCLTALVC